MTYPSCMAFIIWMNIDFQIFAEWYFLVQYMSTALSTPIPWHRGKSTIHAIKRSGYRMKIVNLLHSNTTVLIVVFIKLKMFELR